MPLTSRPSSQIVRITNNISSNTESDMLKRALNASSFRSLGDDPLIKKVVKIASHAKNNAKALNFFQKGQTRIAAIAASTG